MSSGPKERRTKGDQPRSEGPPLQAESFVAGRPSASQATWPRCREGSVGLAPNPRYEPRADRRQGAASRRFARSWRIPVIERMNDNTLATRKRTTEVTDRAKSQA